MRAAVTRATPGGRAGEASGRGVGRARAGDARDAGDAGTRAIRGDAHER